jgi:hypothetical protein
MPASFIYLTSQGRGNAPPRGSDEAVESCYKRKDLIHRPVIRDELNNRYHVFDSRAEFLEWYDKVPEAERCCHETVFGWSPQRIKFDIDAPSHKLDALPESVLALAIAAAEDRLRDDTPMPALLDDDLQSLFDEILDTAPENLVESLDVVSPPLEADLVEAGRRAKIEAIVGILIEAILDELYVAYYGIEDLVATRDDLAVTDSSGATVNGWKYSYHILALPYALVDNNEAREFTARVLERLPASVRGFVDPDVNKKTQNFRLTGSAKPGTGRYKLATPEVARVFGTARNLGVADLFVTAASGTRVLARVYTTDALTDSKTNTHTMLTVNDPVVRAALDLATSLGATAGHRLSEVRGTLLCFLRDAPSHCRICDETHHNDNSLMIGIDVAGHDGPWPGTGLVECQVVEHCRQARGKRRTLGEITMRAEELRGIAPAVTGTRAAAPAAPLISREHVAAQVAAIHDGHVNPHDAISSEFECLPDAQKTVYSDEARQDQGDAPLPR